MDEIMGKIKNKKKQLNLLKKSRDFEDELVQLDRRKDEITKALAELGAELVYNDLSLQRVNSYLVKVLGRRK